MSHVMINKYLIQLTISEGFRRNPRLSMPGQRMTNYLRFLEELAVRQVCIGLLSIEYCCFNRSLFFRLLDLSRHSCFQPQSLVVPHPPPTSALGLLSVIVGELNAPYLVLSFFSSWRGWESHNQTPRNLTQCFIAQTS